MDEKHFIALADRIRLFNKHAERPFGHGHLLELAEFCKEMNPHFNRDRWLDYIDGKCGPNGGKVK